MAMAKPITCGRESSTAVSGSGTTSTRPNRHGLDGGEIAGGVGTSGANIRYARLQNTGRADYVPVDPKTGAIAAWLGGCGELSTTEKNHKVSIARGELGGKGNLTHAWILKQHPLDGSELKATDFCDFEGWQERPFSDTTPPPDYPIAIRDIPKLFDRQCFYGGNMNRIGQLVCDGVSGTRCYKDPLIRIGTVCGDVALSFTRELICKW